MKIYFKILLNICIIIVSFCVGKFYKINEVPTNNVKCNDVAENKKCDCDKICDDLLRQFLNNDDINSKNGVINTNNNKSIKTLKEELDNEIISEENNDEFIIIEENDNLDNNLDNNLDSTDDKMERDNITRNNDINIDDIINNNDNKNVNVENIANIETIEQDTTINDNNEVVQEINLHKDNNINNVNVPSLKENEVIAEEDIFEEVIIEDNVQQ